MKIFPSFLLLACLIFLFASNVFPQSIPYHDSWRWVLFTSEMGLPSNRVFDVLEAPDGTVWASTEFGLAWYDGYLWHALKENETIIPHGKYDLIVDSNGVLYFQKEGRLYVGGKEGFHHQPVYVHNQKLFITTVAYLQKTGIVISTDSCIYSLRDSVATPFPFMAELKNEKVLNLFSGRSTILWIITDSGMYWYSEQQLRKRFTFPAEPFRINRFVENSSGSGLMFVAQPKSAEGIWQWNSESEPEYAHEIKLTPVESFDIREDNYVLLSQSQGTILQRVRNEWMVLTSHPVQMNNIVSLRYRSNGDVWLGTEQGLYLLKLSSNKWRDISNSSVGSWNNVNEIILANDTTLWAVTEEGIAKHFHDGTRQLIDHIGSTPMKILTGVAEDNEGNIWVSSGTSFEGAFRWDGKTWKHFGYQQGLDAGCIHRIRKDRFGRLWFFGLERRDAVERHVEKEPGAYVLADGRFTQWGIPQGLPRGKVYAVDAASDGTLWFATLAGISRWKPNGTSSNDGSWQHWTHHEGLRLDRIFNIMVDRNDKVWFCDQSSGLGYFYQEQPKYYTSSDGLISNTVWDIKEDSSGKLWISTRSGISVFDGEAWYSIDANDGMTNTRLWSLLPMNQYVYIGTYGNGIAILNKKEISSHPPQIHVSQPLFSEDMTQIQWNVFAYWGEYQNNRIETRYRLHNEPWSEWSTIRTVSFFDLTPGKHVLEIQTKKILGELPAVNQSITLDVPYPYYLRPLFYIPIGVLVLIVIAFRTRFVFQRNLQEKVLRQSEERYRVLAEAAHDAIIIVGKNHSVLYVNSYTLGKVGREAKDLLGKPWEQVPLFPVSREFREKITSVLEEGKTEHYEQSLQFSTDVKWYSTILTPLRHATGEIFAFMAIARDITTRKEAEEETQRLVTELQTAFSQIKTLKGLLPICSHCKKIRDDQGYWLQLEKYLIQHSDATFTHGICPDCIKQHFPKVKVTNKNSDNSSSDNISS